MGMCTSGYIFQSKVDELLGDINGVKNNINDIIFLSKDCFINHIEQLRKIFVLLHASDLNIRNSK